MLNTILLALSTLVTALTPIMLAVINKRQAMESEVKTIKQEQMHKELLNRLNVKTY